jgi:hypothetical protein
MNCEELLASTSIKEMNIRYYSFLVKESIFGIRFAVTALIQEFTDFLLLIK